MKLGTGQSINKTVKGGGGGGAAPSLYQAWSGYDDSPFLTADYPNQCIFEEDNGYIYLVGCNEQLWYYTPQGYMNLYCETSGGDGVVYLWSSGWGLNATITNNQTIVQHGARTLANFLEANENVFNDFTPDTNVFFAKTT